MKRMLCWSLGCFILAMIGWGCSKTTPQPVAPTSSISFFHGAPSGQLLNVFLDNTQINSSAFEYTNFSGALAVPSGNRNVKFTNVASSTKLIDTTLNLLESKNYSVFVITKQSSISTLVTLDEGALTLPTSDVMIRYIHLSPDTPSAYIALTGETSPLFTPQTYLQSSPFKELVSKPYTFEIRASSDNHVIASAPLTPRVGSYYSIILRGYITPPTGNSNKVTSQIIVN